MAGQYDFCRWDMGWDVPEAVGGTRPHPSVWAVSILALEPGHSVENAHIQA